MAKTLPANYTTTGPDRYARTGSDVLYDGEGRWQTINRNHNWLAANRVKEHVTAHWPPAGGWTPDLQENAGPTDRLEYLITPRTHVVRIRIWVNAETPGGNGTVAVRVGAGAPINFVFAGPYNRANEQTGTLVVTGGVPAATDRITVALTAPGGSTINLRMLAIRDDNLAWPGDAP